MATARWVLPVPVPPTSTTLRLASRKPPMARSRIRGSLTGEAAKSNSANSLAAGSLADAIWYLMERAVLSAISAFKQRADDLLHWMAALEPVGEDVVVGGAHARELQLRHHRHPRPKLRHRLDLARVAGRGLVAPYHLAHRVLRNPQIPGDLLDRNALNQMIPADPRDRLHYQHLPPPRPSNYEVRSWTQTKGGQFWTPITPDRGSIFHADQHRPKRSRNR